METAPRAGKIDRRQILKGVYEDNLRTVLNQPAPRRRDTEQQRPRKSGMSLLAGLALILIGGFAYGSLQASLNQEEAPDRQPVISAAGAPAPSNVSTVLSNTGQARMPFESELRVASLYGLQVKTIVIDPGHGGMDPGTVGELGTLEKDITLDVARRLKARLEQNYGYQILLTRTGDEKVSLRERVEFSNTHQADLFVSIHVNWLPVEPLSAVETYYFGPRAEGQAAELALRENEDSEYTVAEFNEMLQSIGNTIKLQESERLAEAVQQSLYRNLSQTNSELNDWGVKRAPFVVLLGVNAPGILAEIACISNHAEENRLNRDDYRENLAIFLEEGILNYLHKRSDELVTSDGDTGYAAKEEDQIH
jgi:N-acetylmuramoyl-L-alanine amidase